MSVEQTVAIAVSDEMAALREQSVRGLGVETVSAGRELGNFALLGNPYAFSWAVQLRPAPPGLKDRGC